MSSAGHRKAMLLMENPITSSDYCQENQKSNCKKTERMDYPVKIVCGQSFPVHRNTCLCSQHAVNWNAKAKDSVPDHMVVTRSTPMKRSLELQKHPEVQNVLKFNSLTYPKRV